VAPQGVSFETNGRSYRAAPSPVVAICIDGCAPEYLDEAILRGRMPRLARAIVAGARGLARAAMPTFTNPNNASIITGVPPSVHGITGNFFLDPRSGEEVMMNDGAYLRAGTIVASAALAGRRAAIVTAKDKLRTILGKGLDGIAVSAECAAEARADTHGIGDVEALIGEPAPKIYSGDISVYVLRIGSALVEAGLADLLYLSLTDFIQHKHGPTEPEALAFYEQVDEQIGRLLDGGAVLGITADHGMNAKQRPDGTPNVLYLEPPLRSRFGEGVRVILPITDPYVAHHGALGSYATIHVEDESMIGAICDLCLEQPGVTEAHPRDRGARLLELAPDRIGDVIVLSGRDVVLGKSPDAHDLSGVETGLRSHGGRYEEMVPFVFSRPLSDEHATRLHADPRNFDVFDFLLNGTM